jgi:hypothetical protein
MSPSDRDLREQADRYDGEGKMVLASKCVRAVIAEGASGAFHTAAGTREGQRFWVFCAGSSIHTGVRSERFQGLEELPFFFAQVMRHQGV